MEEVKDTCVYMHVRKESREAFYIGIGNAKRPYIESGRNKLWKNTVSKYGYDIIILKENLSWSDACKIEIDLIKYFGRRDLGEGTLVNMTDGGEGNKGAIRTLETRSKMSASQKGRKHSAESIAKMSAFQKGRKKSAEHIAKLSAAHKGKTISAETKSRMKKAAKLRMTKSAKDNLSIKHKGKILSADTKAKIRKAKASLKEYQVIEILKEVKYNPYYGQNIELGKKYGVTKDTISKIKRNITHKHIDRETI